MTTDAAVLEREPTTGQPPLSEELSAYLSRMVEALRRGGAWRLPTGESLQLVPDHAAGAAPPPSGPTRRCPVLLGIETGHFTQMRTAYFGLVEIPEDTPTWNTKTLGGGDGALLDAMLEPLEREAVMGWFRRVMGACGAALESFSLVGDKAEQSKLFLTTFTQPPALNGWRISARLVAQDAVLLTDRLSKNLREAFTLGEPVVFPRGIRPHTANISRAKNLLVVDVELRRVWRADG